MRGKTMEFELQDMCALGLPAKKGKIEIVDGGSGIFLTFDGYGTKCSDGHGPQVSIEYFHGKVQVLIWGDINKEDMTQVVDLEGAREESRHVAPSQARIHPSPEAVDSVPVGYRGPDGRCVHCGAGNDAHHSYSCPTNMHPDKRGPNEE